MAVHGRNAEVLLDGKDISGYLNAADLSADVDTAETTAFKKSWKTYIPGQAAATVEAGGLYDPDLTDIRATLGADPGSVLTVAPSGYAIGDGARLVEVLSTKLKESSPVGGVVAIAWTVQADGPVGFGRILHDLSAEAADGSASSVDGSASSSNGAVAHLHVTSVSAGESIDVIIEDSADNVSFATIGTFTTKSAAGAERITIAGTVRRYVRATWTITSDGSPSITFAVSLARL